MRNIDTIIIHCSDTPPSMDIGVDEIRRWHVEERGWDDIGYHFVIRRDGTIEPGRNIDIQGAHAAGHNHGSLGICVVGGQTALGEPDCNYTSEQWKSLDQLCTDMDFMYSADIIGHRDVSKKDCPCFDVAAWAKTIGA